MAQLIVISRYSDVFKDKTMEDKNRRFVLIQNIELAVTIVGFVLTVIISYPIFVIEAVFSMGGADLREIIEFICLILLFSLVYIAPQIITLASYKIFVKKYYKGKTEGIPNYIIDKNKIVCSISKLLITIWSLLFIFTIIFLTIG